MKHLSFVGDRSVIVDGERFDGSLIVFADGARTNALERMPSMLEPERVVWGASSTVPSGPSTDAIHIHVGPHAPGGRTQWTPLGGGRWAFWSFHGSTPDEALANHRRHLESVGFDPQECMLQAVHPDPVYTLPGTLLGPGCIAIGGAAGQGGLEMGMVCGLLAARHTVRASTTPGIRASKLAGYQQEFDARYRPGYLSLRRVTDALTRMDAAALDSILAAPRGRVVPIDWVQHAHRGPVQLGRAALRVLRHIPQPARVVPRLTRQVSRSLLDSGL